MSARSTTLQVVVGAWALAFVAIAVVEVMSFQLPSAAHPIAPTFLFHGSLLPSSVCRQQQQQQHRQNPQPRYNECSSCSIILFSSSTDQNNDNDNFSDFDTEVSASVGQQQLSSSLQQSTQQQSVFQTEAGVIMPEGGANPCVIKVRLI